ncbi:MULTISPECIES: methyltransferase domain-containing protein [unclassified Chelatococcus]|uniref:class I SAM-dependent methyltransferase n=1 Tax=unclassified Chelatococcus TaxID=2638111 RepID=UPI001BD12449|nr:MULTISPECIES: methyltransferase domain-containing protein [unclassified Chelatococcus]MBS7696331.1 methyltransferase domain-containing protein [Chelatococcus sp. YT9]MBX3556941.1 methyltransferase domain-containing protein [Chelatococcus sp.]
MDTEREVANHYSRAGLESAILDALRASGADVDHLTSADLRGADEFHLGWHAATAALASDLGLTKGERVLDVGSGIGGPARYFAETYGCVVSGIDLTEDYVAVSTALTQRCGLDDRVSFTQASALALPFPSSHFDATTLIHVGMNIPDKTALFSEIRRILKQGGRFGVYDIMRLDDVELPFPMPWAQTSATSYVERPDTYRNALESAGFVITEAHDRSLLALDLARAMRDKVEKEGAPPLGLHLLMGPAGGQRMENVLGALQRGHIAPIAMIARAL